MVEQGRLADLAVTLRSQDVSRQNQTWGTVVPVVTSSSLFAAGFALLDIPVDSQFRTLLRVYSFNAASEPSVRIRVYSVEPTHPYPDQTVLAPDTLLLETNPQFTLPSSDPLGYCPAYAEVPLSANSALANATRLRVDVEPLTGGKDYWGFVSVTHNDTQYVTVIQPK